MSPDETPAPAPAAPARTPWIRRRTNQAGLALLLLLLWSLAANTWQDKGCDRLQSYGLVISHMGTPDHYEGCESEPGGPEYTDDYDG